MGDHEHKEGNTHQEATYSLPPWPEEYQNPLTAFPPPSTRDERERLLDLYDSPPTYTLSSPTNPHMNDGELMRQGSIVIFNGKEVPVADVADEARKSAAENARGSPRRESDSADTGRVAYVYAVAIAADLQNAVRANRGPAITAFENELRALQELVATARAIDQLERAWQVQMQRAETVAGDLSDANAARDAAHTLAYARKAALDYRISELNRTLTSAQNYADRLAAYAATLAAQDERLTTAEQRRGIQRRAAEAEESATVQRGVAQLQDQLALEEAWREVRNISLGKTDTVEVEPWLSDVAGQPQTTHNSREQTPTHSLSETAIASPAQLNPGHLDPVIDTPEPPIDSQPEAEPGSS